MKHVVELKYTNPSHEHVSLRRRVETVNRVVEAQSADEALNRAANQQRSLGFRIQSANIVEQKVEEPTTQIFSEEVESVDEGVATAQKVMDRANVVAKTNPDPKKRFAAGGLAQKAMLRTINPTGVNTGIVRGGGNKTYRMVTGKVPPYQLTPKTGVSEEIEEVDEAKKPLKPSYWKAEWRLGTQSEVDKNNKKIYDRLSKTDPDKAKAFHDNLMRMKKKDVKEEVEQIDEVGDTAKGRAALSSYIKKKYDQFYHNRMMVKTQDNLDRLRKDANKNLARAEKRLDPKGPFANSKFIKSEEVEQIDELKKSTLASYVKGATRDVASASRLQRGYETDAARSEFAPVRRGSELAAKNMRKFAAKRSRGIAKAVDKLAKEEVELDETKKPDASMAMTNQLKMKMISDKDKRTLGKVADLMAAQKKKDKPVKEETVTEAEREAGYKMPAHVAAGQKKFDAQAKGQNKPRPQAGTLAAAKMKKEEVETVEEGLMSGLKKAQVKWKTAHRAVYGKDPSVKSMAVGAIARLAGAKAHTARAVGAAVGGKPVTKQQQTAAKARAGKVAMSKMRNEEKHESGDDVNSNVKSKKAAEKMTKKAAEVRKSKIEGSVNKINMEPTMDLNKKAEK